MKEVCLLVGCLTSQERASVSQGRTCSDNFTCCHTEIEAAGITLYLQYHVYTSKRNVPLSESTVRMGQSSVIDRLVGLVVKASASSTEDPRFESRLRRDFSGVESYQ